MMSTSSSSASRTSSAASPLFLEIMIICVYLSTSDILDDPVSSVCTQINKYLEASYGCRPNDFHRHVSCTNNRIDLRCPRQTQLAIHSASYGWSERLVTQGKCPGATSRDRGCPRTCVLDEVRRLCQGKRRCLLDPDKGLVVVDTARCQAGSVKYLGVIHTCVKKPLLSHIVSSDSVFVNPCEEEGDNINAEEQSEPGRPHPPFVASYSATVASGFHSAWMPTDPGSSAPAPAGGGGGGGGGKEDLGLPQGDTAGGIDRAPLRNAAPQNPQSSNTHSWYYRPQSTQGRSLREGYIRNGSGVNGGPRSQTTRPGEQIKQVVASTESPPSAWIQSFMDLVWTWNYVNQNTEKLVLYLLLGLSLGTISILFTILCYMIYCARRGTLKATPSSAGGSHHHHQQGGTGVSCSSPTWRMPESESSTGDDRTLHDDDVELTSFNHIDSLQRRTAYHHQHHQGGGGGGGGGGGAVRPPSYSSRPQSPTALTAAATTAANTATISRTYSQANPVVTRCMTPSPPSMTMPVVPNGGEFMPPAPLMINGRGVVDVVSQPQPPPAHCVGSLGRTYPSHYRRDSYQLDPAPGCRTLQPMQHYYG